MSGSRARGCFEQPRCWSAHGRPPTPSGARRARQASSSASTPWWPWARSSPCSGSAHGRRAPPGRPPGSCCRLTVRGHARAALRLPWHRSAASLSLCAHHVGDGAGVSGQHQVMSHGHLLFFFPLCVACMGRPSKAVRLLAMQQALPFHPLPAPSGKTASRADTHARKKVRCALRAGGGRVP